MNSDDKKNFDKIRSLLSGYQMACDSILYKTRDCTQTEKDCYAMEEWLNQHELQCHLDDITLGLNLRWRNFTSSAKDYQKTILKEANSLMVERGYTNLYLKLDIDSECYFRIVLDESI